MSEVKKRDRVFRACEFCRKRKVKCDGNHPCVNCIQNKKECQYKEAPLKEPKVRKPVVRKPNLYSLKLDYIDDRLSKLENLLTRFISSVDKRSHVEAAGSHGSHSAGVTREDPDSGDIVEDADADADAEDDGEEEDADAEEDNDGEDDDDDIDDDEDVVNVNSRIIKKESPKVQPGNTYPNVVDPVSRNDDANSGNTSNYYNSGAKTNAAASTSTSTSTSTSGAASASASSSSTNFKKYDASHIGRLPPFTAKRKTSSFSTGNEYRIKTEEYFGAHSILSIYTEKSLKRFEASLPELDGPLIDSLRKIPFVFQYVLKPFILKWIDPPTFDAREKREILQGIFPEDSKFVYEVLDMYYLDFFPACFILDAKKIKDLFKTYYEQRDRLEAAKLSSGLTGSSTSMHSSTGGSSSGTPSTHPSRLKISELLIMSICLAFCINARIDYLATSGSSSNSPELTSGTHTQESTGFQSKYSIDELSAILEDNFKRAIYYYHMILVISDSISTVIAILFMITFVENTYLATHINTQLIAVAVRYAQEFGLHRSETYEGLSKEDNQLRQRVWVICRTLDTEICFRSGKPALVNVSDISSEFDDELLQKLKYQASLVTSSLTTTPLETPNVGSESTNSSSVSELAYSQKEVIHRYLLMEFTRIRSSSYNKLFVDSVKTISFDSLIEIIDEINKDMFKMVDVIPLDIKPRFFYDPNFAQAIGKIDSSYWATQLAYFFHLMLINRIPSVINPISNDGNGKSSSRNMHTANNSSKENKEKDNLPETEEDIDKITKVNRYLNISLNSARTILILVENVFTGVGVSASDEGKSIPKSVVTWNIFYPFAAFLYLLGNTIDNYNSPDCLNDATLLINSSIKFFNYMNRSESSKIRNQKNKVVDLAVRILMNILLKYLQIYRNVNFFDTFPGLKQYLEGTDDLFPEIFRKEKVRKELLAYSYRMTDISALQRDSFENHGVSGLPVPILNHTNQQSPPLQKHNNMPLPRQPIPQHTYTLPPLQPQQVPEQVPMSSSSQSPGANEPPSESYRPHLLYQVLNRPPQPPQNIVPQIPVTLPPPTPRQVPAQGSWMPMNQHQVHGPLQVPGAAPVPITVGGPTPISNTGQLPMEYPQEYLPYDPQSLQEQLLAGNVDDISDSIFHSQVFGLSNLFFDKNT